MVGADISPEARAMIRMLRAYQVTPPEADGIESFRAVARAAYEPYVRDALQKFDGEVEDIEIAGIGCMQVTPAGWLEDSGGCVQYAYGGGYVSGSPYEDLIVTVPLARLSGARIVMVDYRLSPEHPYPQPQQDMLAVYPALLERYGAARLALAGESAGGNQVLALLHRIRDKGLAIPSCAALLSPWCDLENRGDSHDFNDGRDPTLNQSWVGVATAMHAAGHPLDDPGISPLHGDMSGLPPILITTGSRDLLLSQSLRLAQRLRAAGVDCDLRVWEGMWHVFEFYPTPEAERSIAEIAAFTKSHL